MPHLLGRIRDFLGRYLDALILITVIAVALSVRLDLMTRIPVFVSKDSQSYFLPAWDLVHGDAFVLGLRRTPGYPLFLALVQRMLGPELQSVVIAQHLLGVATAALTCLLGRSIFGSLAGLVAGLLVALSAPLIIYEHYVLTESLFTFALTGAMLVFVMAMRSQARRATFAAGLALGVAAMVRPVGQILAPIVIAGVAAARLPHWRKAAIAAVICGLGLAAALTPWAIRNRLVSELGGTTTFGRTLIARTAYYDRGFAFYAPGWGDAGDSQLVAARRIIQDGANRRQSDGTIAGRLRQELSLGPIEVNSVMRQVATEAILRRPDYFITGSLRFAWEIFDGQDERIRNHADEVKDVVWEARTAHLLPGKLTPAQEREQRDAQQLLNLYQPARHTTMLAVLCALATLGAMVRRSWRVALPIALAALTHILLSAALDGPQERYRYTVDPLISVLAAGGLATVGWLTLAIGRVVSRVRAHPTRQPDVAASR
ncbi:MAG: ArnT family glycosyltransferase [Chloroflexota bacterium]